VYRVGYQRETLKVDILIVDENDSSIIGMDVVGLLNIWNLSFLVIKELVWIQSNLIKGTFLI
jgi:hypothetical protein